MKTILLIGGTSETESIAQALAGDGFSVLVCTATDLPLRTGAHPAIRRHCGRLAAPEFESLARDEHAAAIVNAAHPYAADVRRATRQAAAAAGIPHIEFLRPASNGAGTWPGVIRAGDHREAAAQAIRAGTSILLTIGVNHLATYVAPARAAGRSILARVLPRPESMAACRTAGLREEEIIVSRGVPGVDENEALIRRHGISVLVTKESGAAGGVEEKIEAARRTGCTVVLVNRPTPATDAAGTVPDLLERVRRATGATAQEKTS